MKNDIRFIIFPFVQKPFFLYILQLIFEKIDFFFEI